MPEPLLIVGTAEGLHLRGRRIAAFLAEHTIPALANDGVTWSAILDAKTLWRSGDLERWEEVASVERRDALCVHAGSNGVLVGTSDAHLLRLGTRGLDPVASFDQIEGRDDWYTPWGGPPETRSVSANVDGVLHVNVHMGGILRSRDGGRSWEPTIDMDADVREPRPCGARTIANRTAMSHFWRSETFGGEDGVATGAAPGAPAYAPPRRGRRVSTSPYSCIAPRKMALNSSL